MSSASLAARVAVVAGGAVVTAAALLGLAHASRAPEGGSAVALACAESCPAGATTATQTQTPIPTPAPAPGPPDFSIGVDIDGDGALECESDGSPGTKCDIGLGSQFTVTVFLNDSGNVAYEALSIYLEASGPGLKEGTADANLWPDCVFEAAAYPGNAVSLACARGLTAPPSTYTGPVGAVDLGCGATGAITLVPGSADTFLIDEALVTRYEAAEEAIQVNCSASVTPPPTATRTPTPTPTPAGGASPTPTLSSGETPTPTGTPADATPVVTPTPDATGGPIATATAGSSTPTAQATATRTPTRTPTPRPNGVPGDVSCNRRTDSLDAALILQLDAGIIDELSCPANGDVSGDGRTNALDAALVLQYDAGLIDDFPA